MAAKSYTAPKKPKRKAAKQAKSKPASTRGAKSLTTPKDKTKKVSRVTPTRKSVTIPDVRKSAHKAAKKANRKPVTEHFIEVAAVTPSAMRAAHVAEIPYEEAKALMSDPAVQVAVADRRAMTLAQECGITSQKIMREYAAMGFSNMRDYVRLLSADTMTEGLDGLTDEQSAAIQELTTETYFDEEEGKTIKRVKLKLYPKEVALNKMAQHLGIKGFGGQLKDAGINRVGVKTIVRPDGTVETTAMIESLSDEELERIALGLDDETDTNERTE